MIGSYPKNISKTKYYPGKKFNKKERGGESEAESSRGRQPVKWLINRNNVKLRL